MLGTNDFQCTHENNAWLSAQGTVKLVDIIRKAPIELGMPIPEILLIAPPRIIEPKVVISGKFKGAENRCIGLASELKQVANELSTFYFDSGSVIEASSVDGIHLDKSQHRTLGEAVGNAVLTFNLF